ncbi:MAG: hypothetical protein ACLFTA_02365 [Candidatus Nanohaloarchaea archaeon]
MKKTALIPALLILVGLASGFQVTSEALDPQASMDDSAEIRLNVENSGSPQKYDLSILDYHRSRWYSYSDSKTLNSSNSYFNVEINPEESAIRGNYRTDFVIRNEEGEEVRDSFSFNVQRDRGLNLLNLDKNESYKPGKTIEIGLTFRNVDSSTSEYRDVEINLLNSTKTVELGPIVPGGERRVSTTFEVPRYESPGRKTLSIGLNGREYTESIQVEEVESFEKNRSREDMLLVVNDVLNVRNTGNVESTFNYSIEKPSYISPVVYAPEAVQTDNGSSTVYSWSENLQPGEEMELRVRTDYWIPVSGVLALLIGLVALKRITSTVSVEKTVKKTDKGLDITLQVENSSSQSYGDVLLEDFIPNIAGLNSKFDMADPEVKQTGDGAELRWWIQDLHPGDQRIFRYSIEPKVEVEEGVELDPAVLRDGEHVLDTSKTINAEFKPE